MMCSWDVTEKPKIQEKGFKLALTIYRDFMQTFTRFWEQGQYKPKTTGTLTFLVCGRLLSLSLCKGLLTEMAEMALSGEEGVGTGVQLAPK